MKSVEWFVLMGLILGTPGIYIRALSRGHQWFDWAMSGLAIFCLGLALYLMYFKKEYITLYS